MWKLILILFIVLFGCTKKTQNFSQSSRVLQIYCWSNYFSPEIIRTFEQKTNTKVEFNYFSSNEELLAKLQAGARGYDIIVPSSYLIRALKSLELLEPMGRLEWPELKGLIPLTKSFNYDPEYAIPYAWGTSGLAVNRTKIKSKIDSWAWVFDRPELKGQISMLDDAPAVVGIALKYLGYSYNESKPDALAKVKQLLLKQKKFLKAYTADSQQILKSGEVALAHAYSGDTLQVQKRNPNIEYVLPKEGGEVFMDNLAIPKGAPSPDLAKEFIRFTLQQTIAAIQVEHLFFSPVIEVGEFLKNKSLITNRAVFPNKDDLKKYEFMEDDPDRIEQIQKLWTELKSS